VLPKLSGTALDGTISSDAAPSIKALRNKTLSDKTLDCYQHADRRARQAEQQRDPKLREDFRYLERGWLKIARSLEFAERREPRKR
jgi:hypothetical protein